jgi:chemotaxis regulatin CheY-phosphate phosphatase CheZ
MEKAEVSRLINSFSAIKGYFDTTKKYMPQITKLVEFIEDVVPLLNLIHTDLHQSTNLIPTATEKLGKVTSATEMAATEVMDIVDNVIQKLNSMGQSLEDIEKICESSALSTQIKEKTDEVRAGIDGSQEDLFSIMNALQFQDITTQQINSISDTITNVQIRLGDLLKGFEDDGITIKELKKVSFDPNAEFDFDSSAKSQKVADEILKNHKKSSFDEQVSEKDKIALGSDGQPDITAIMNEMKNDSDKNNK